MRTISTTSAIIQEDNAIYLNPVNKKRQINFDEELLVIFFSILNYIGDTYGFPKEINCNFDLITGKRFEKYRNGYGIIRLNQIKYKYFSDKALQLWKLCYAFFDKSRQIYVNTSQKEYLLVKSFHIVFEAIIDALVGDSPLPDGMDKKQEDGKIVDHLFTAKSLIEGEASNTYYIGDSKYYKMGNELGKESVYKQYTYARNVIQWNLDIFNDGKVPPSGIKLRDDETEGYNIIPNFSFRHRWMRNIVILLMVLRKLTERITGICRSSSKTDCLTETPCCCFITMLISCLSSRSMRGIIRMSSIIGRRISGLNSVRRFATGSSRILISTQCARSLQ